MAIPRNTNVTKMEFRRIFNPDIGLIFPAAPSPEGCHQRRKPFDVYPDETLDYKKRLSGQGISTQGISRYPGALSAFGMNGRTLYPRLAYP